MEKRTAKKALLQRNLQKISILGGWVTLGAMIIISGVHAVWLASYSISGDGIFWLIRLFSPIIVEMAATVTAIGFAANYWREGQRTTGLVIELVWFIFACLNMLASFSIETNSITGLALPQWLAYWLAYGLPISALIQGALFYATIRLDPDDLRESQATAAANHAQMIEFDAKQRVLVSNQMTDVLENRAWLDIIDDMQGRFSPEQIAYMFKGVPQLSGGDQALLPTTTIAATGPVHDIELELPIMEPEPTPPTTPPNA